MSTIILKKDGAKWIADVNGILHDFRFTSLDTEDSVRCFRSIVQPVGAVEFDCTLAGELQDLKLIRAGAELPLAELTIPPTHSLACQIDLVAL